MAVAAATLSLPRLSAVATAVGIFGQSAVHHPFRHVAVGVVQAKGVGCVLSALARCVLSVITVNYCPCAVTTFYRLVGDVRVVT